LARRTVCVNGSRRNGFLRIRCVPPKKTNKISEQENTSSLGKAKINGSAIEDTVKISREARNITKEFGRREERKASELKEQERQSKDNEKKLRTYKENS
jgi:hypothetical protein